MEKLNINHEEEVIWNAFGITEAKAEAMTKFIVSQTNMATGKLNIMPMSKMIETLIYMFANNTTEAIGVAVFFSDFRIMPDHIIEKYTNLKRADRKDFNTLSKLVDLALEHEGIETMPDEVREMIVSHLDDPEIDCERCPGKDADCGILKIGKAIGHEKAKRI